MVAFIVNFRDVISDFKVNIGPLEQTAVFAKDIFQFFLNLDPYFVFYFYIEINGDGIRGGDLNFGGTANQNSSNHQYAGVTARVEAIYAFDEELTRGGQG